MEELTEKQMKTRWVDIKKQIKERPLLAYRVGIPLEDWDKYMYFIFRCSCATCFGDLVPQKKG
jgi:hypothetical protein